MKKYKCINLSIITILSLAFLLLQSCMGKDDGTFSIRSRSFKEGGVIDEKYCYNRNGHDGENISPQLRWSGAPDETVSYTLIVDDPSGGNWSHWILYNIPASATSLPEGFNSDVTLGTEGRISSGALGYEGPYPPTGNHSYSFRIYALDTTLELEPQSASRSGIIAAMSGHILAEAELLGTHAAH